MKIATRNWNVNGSRCCTLSWEKTLKTSTTTTTTRSWIVNGLFHSPLQKRRIGHNRRHFHQLFHHLRETPTSDRGAGKPPPALAVFWPREALYHTCSTSSFFLRSVTFAEWWSLSARTIATAIRSCRRNERRRRCLRRRALPVPPSQSRSTFILSTARTNKEATQKQRNVSEPGGGGGGCCGGGGCGGGGGGADLCVARGSLSIQADRCT